MASKISAPPYRRKDCLKQLNYANCFINIPPEYIQIILHCRKSVFIS